MVMSNCLEVFKGSSGDSNEFPICSAFLLTLLL
jgi:hypothetical protein